MNYTKRKQRGGTRAERYDARTERRVIRKHERERRKYFRKTGEVDPLAEARIHRNKLENANLQPAKIVEHGTPKFSMPGEEKHGIRYRISTFANPRFLGSGLGGGTEALSDKVQQFKNRRDRFRPEDVEPETNKKKRKVGKVNQVKTKKPSGKTGNVIRDVVRGIGRGCKRVWDHVKHNWTLPPGCRGPKSAYNELGGYY